MNDSNYRYLAFISYSRRDNDDREDGRRWAEWIKSTIEEFAVKANTYRSGIVNPTEVFLDRRNLEGDDLGQSLKKSLDESQALILVCSPNSAASKYVNLELAHFLERENAVDFVIPVVVSGTNPEELFCGNNEVLMSRLRADFRLKAEPGSTSEGWTDPSHYRKHLQTTQHGHGMEQKKWLAAYTRDYAYARSTLLQRVSRLPRQEVDRIDSGTEARKWRRIATMSIGSAVLMSAIGMQMIRSERMAQEERKRAEDARRIADAERSKAVEATAIAVRERLNAEAAGKQAMEEKTKATEALGKALADRVRAERSERFVGNAYERSASLAGDLLAEMRDKLGPQANDKLIDDLCAQAIERLGNLASSADGKDEKYMRAVTLGHMGILTMLAGNLERSSELFVEAKSIQTELLAEQPRNVVYRHGKSLACDNLGDMYLKTAELRAGPNAAIDPEDRDLAKAIEEYQQGLSIASELAATENADLRWLDDLSVSYFKMAEAQKLAQRYQAAAETLALGLPSALKAADSDPQDDRLQAHLGNYYRLAGELALLRGLDEDAHASFNKALEIIAKLRDGNPKEDSYPKMIGMIENMRKEAANP